VGFDSLCQQADSASEKNEHHDSVKETCRLKVDLKIHYYAGNDDHGAGENEEPSDDRPPVEEHDSDAEY
jgi:hypothetical protein